MATNCGSCGGGGAHRQAAKPIPRGPEVDPTRALFAAASPRFEVYSTAGRPTGKVFATLVRAQDYARQTGGIVRAMS